MYSLSILAIVSCLFSLVLTPLIRGWSIPLGLADRPDQKRKLHQAATPRSGGVPILFSYIAAYAVVLLLPLNDANLIGNHLTMIGRLLPPVAVVFMTGLLDDWFNLRPWQKLMGELCAAVWAYSAGVRVLEIAGHEISPWLSLLLTVGWLVLCSNALNLIDGIDGLAAGVGLTVTVTMLIAGLLHGEVLAVATAPLAGALLGFLLFNFSPASIFLGDSGSLLIGFLLGSYGVIWSQMSPTILGLTAPAMALALPLVEVALSVARRFLRNDPIFTGDRGHIHHRLLDRGFTPRRVALMLYAVCILGASVSLLQSVVQRPLACAMTLLLGMAAWIGVHFLGYTEFAVTSEFLRRGLRPTLSAHVQLKSLEIALLRADSVGQCWEVLVHTARSLGYGNMTARLGGSSYATAPDRPKGSSFWQVRLNLPEGNYVNITQHEGCTSQPVLLIPFVTAVRAILPGRLAILTKSCDEVPFGASMSIAIREQSVDRRVRQAVSRNSSTRTVMSSDCAAPSVKAATAS